MSVDAPVVFAPPRKFQHKYARHIILFLLTLGTTTLIGGFTFSLPLLTILGAHEFGHYWFCRWRNVDATLPYFLPLPLPPAGTLGAVIRIREPFPSKAALFDIAVAGPIAGFITLIPFLWLGFRDSTAGVPPQGAQLFGEPLLFKALSWLWFGPLPQGFDELISPMAFAAWFGMLATALNLLPFGQLDGGHIAYAVFGRHVRFVYGATLVGTVLLVIWSVSLIMVAVMMLIMAFFLGLRHPQVPDEDIPLDPKRKLIAVLALVMFILTFTPVPVEFLVGQ